MNQPKERSVAKIVELLCDQIMSLPEADRLDNARDAAVCLLEFAGYETARTRDAKEAAFVFHAAHQIDTHLSGRSRDGSA